MKIMLLVAACMACVIPGFAAQKRVLAFAGSAADVSVNRQLVAQASILAKEMGADVTLIDLKNYSIPIYDADLEKRQGMPEAAKKFQQLVLNSDVLLIASPEYNRSTTPLLMNLFTWLSRKPEGGAYRDVLKDKKVLLLSASPSYDAGFQGLNTVRTIISALQATVLPNQFCLPTAYQAFDEQGALKNKEWQSLLQVVVHQSLVAD